MNRTKVIPTIAPSAVKLLSKVMKKVFVLVFVLTLSPLVHAQDSQFTPPKTFTLSSVVEMTLAAGALAADAGTTRRHVVAYSSEMNPIARPFVYSNAGTVAYFGVAAGGVVLTNHLLRNHPHLRHTFNWSVIASEAAVSIWNVTYSRPSCERIWVSKGILIPPCHF